MAAHAVIGAQPEPVQHSGGASSSTHPLTRPWALALALAIPLAIAYLIWAPPAADLSAAIYRSDLFARVGYTLRDNGWYAVHGHYLLGYSLLSPALGALLGVRVLLALSAVAASVLFGLIAERAFGLAAGRAAAAVFAFGICAELLSGRVPYDLGFAVGLGAVLASMRGRLVLALVLAVLTSVASPVAGLFLALVFLAWTLSDPARLAARAHPRRARADPHAQPRLPRGRLRAVRALGLLAGARRGAADRPAPAPGTAHHTCAPDRAGRSGAVRARADRRVRDRHPRWAATPPVSAPPLAAPLLTGVLWERRHLALCLLAPLLLYWQLNTPIGDLSLIAGGSSANASYYAPLLTELRHLRHDAPTIVEVPLTATHCGGRLRGGP